MPRPPLPAPASATRSGEPASGVSPTVPAPPIPSPSVVVVPPSSATPAPVALPKRCSVCNESYPADFLVCPRDASPLSEDGPTSEVDPLVGRVLGDTYRIIGVIGEGGMARVYEARHLRLGDRRLAIKILHPEFARDPDIVVRFQREAESASAINHPHVMDVFDVHKTPDGRPFLVGEFLEGQELGDHLDKVGRLDVPTAVALTRQICRALNAAHARGIVHRDVKPENVFVILRDGELHAKVIDFGISKAGHRETHLTRTGLIMGTPSYMAPEQARGEKVDHRADVYAVGAILYAALTGQRPFESDDPTTILGMVLTEEPKRPREIEPSIPAGLELVIQRAMAKDPRDRYQSMTELDQALAPFDDADAPRSEALSQALQKGEPTGMHRSPVRDSSRTMAASQSGAEREAREARLARPAIVGYGGAVAVWFVGGFVDALGGAVRFFRQGELTPTETVLLVLGTSFLAVTPAVLAVLHVKKVVWPNTMRSVELASDLKRTVAVALVAYGAAAVVSRVLFTVFLRHTGELVSGAWDAGLFLVSLLGAMVAGGVGPVARAFRRKANG